MGFTNRKFPAAHLASSTHVRHILRPTGGRVNEVLRQPRQVEVGVVRAADGVQDVDAGGGRCGAQAPECVAGRSLRRQELGRAQRIYQLRDNS
jgi:hypothetical protein